jgi:hypothetical protein
LVTSPGWKSLPHALVELAQTIDWSFLEQTFDAVYTDNAGRA